MQLAEEVVWHSTMLKGPRENPDDTLSNVERCFSK